MSKKLTNKFLLLAIVFVMLTSVLFISVLFNNTNAYADDDEITEYQEIHCTYSNIYNVWGVTTFVDLTDIQRPFSTLELDVYEDVETLIISNSGNYLSLENSKITIMSRKKDLTINMNGFDIKGSENNCTIINKSTKGTVNLVNNGTNPVVISGATRTGSGSFEDGMGIAGVIYTKGNISFSGEAGFVIDGAGYISSTTYGGNLDYGNTGLQVNGSKNVYVNTTVDIIGGNGQSGAYIPGLLGFDGGHGGYAFDGSSANIIISDAGYLTLTGGHGGNGACQYGSGTLGAAGKGCAAYKNSIHVNDTSKFEYVAGEDGEAGHYYNK